MSPVHSSNTAAAPRATLRLQLHAGYTLNDVCADLSYFARLGVSHLYLSPISQSRSGSTHGYDVVDHGAIDPERGGEPAFRRLAHEVRRAGMGILLDIVPNHMATDPANAWWWDVLKFGPHSARARWFDINWEAPALPGKVLAPFLGRPYARALYAGDIRVQHEAARGLHVVVHGRPYPLSPESLASLGLQVATEADTMPPQEVQRILHDHDVSHREGRRRLHQLLQRQHYCLSWWRRAADSINWRRFFEVSELIGVRVEEDEVFDAVHALPLQLYAEGLIDGLRIDHVDGLAYPLAYCRRLHDAMVKAAASRPPSLCTDRPWIVVEKILAHGETLDDRWRVSGTSGYDFAADVGGLLHDGAGEAPLSAAWTEICRNPQPPHAWLLEARGEMLARHFIAEREGLLAALRRLPIPAGEGQLDDSALTRAVDALLRHYPTYRSYVEEGTRALHDQYWFDRALQGAGEDLSNDEDALAALRVLDRWLGRDAAGSDEGCKAIQRFQQLTPPLAAKALEDTVFYRYGRLLSRNEVGSHPDVFALSVAAFHQANEHRAEASPRGLLATATHDHKRGEDVRARLAVLSEIPEIWWHASRRWMSVWEHGLPTDADSRAFHYMLLQTVLGAWPPELSPDDEDHIKHYLERIAQWCIKALREGKLISGWFEPQVEREQHWLNYLQELLPGRPGHAMLQELAGFAQRLEPGAIANGLMQTTMRLMSPGIPDLYQGTEWRDFSLVDPDNRRPVDFHAREHCLEQALQGPSGRIRPPLAAKGWDAAAWGDGRIKQALIAALLGLRRECAAAFCDGYEAVEIRGTGTQNLVGFVRGREIVVLAAVKCAASMHQNRDGVPVLPAGFWEDDAALILPEPDANWEDVLRGRRIGPRNGLIPLADLLAGFPLAVLRRDQG